MFTLLAPWFLLCQYKYIPDFLQGRLGPGRLHHCMRLIGAAERGMQMMVQRALSRRAFGKLIAEQGAFRSDVAKVIFSYAILSNINFFQKK